MQTERKKGPHRGVSTYCWYQQLYHNMELQDIFENMEDIGAYGLEILADGIIKGYPNPSTKWLDEWFGLVERYHIVPVEYGHWVESRMYVNRNYTVDECLAMLVHDIKLAAFMGFSCMRTKLSLIDPAHLEPGWEEIIRRALPYAEKYNVIMMPEIHAPNCLDGDPFVDAFVDFVDREQTRHFGMNIDFGVFTDATYPGYVPSRPEQIIPLLPYVHCCHAKFYNMNENFEETTIPYPKVIRIMQEYGWDGYLLSEYEGKNMDVEGYATTQVRRHHVMLKNLLGE